MSTQEPADHITDDMVDCWRVNYGLDKMTPAEAMRWWESSCDGSAPAGAVAALGLCLAERDSLLRDWAAEQGQRTAAVDRAERAELERDRLRADVREMVEFVRQFAGCAYTVAKEIDPRGHSWCEPWLDEVLVAARALLAKHRPDPLQAVADNASDLGHNARIERHARKEQL